MGSTNIYFKLSKYNVHYFVMKLLHKATISHFKCSTVKDIRFSTVRHRKINPCTLSLISNTESLIGCINMLGTFSNSQIFVRSLYQMWMCDSKCVFFLNIVVYITHLNRGTKFVTFCTYCSAIYPKCVCTANLSRAKAYQID